MEQLMMCRICLATDLRMESIVNTHLQDIYEKLTLKQFETKDSKPTLVCYLCYARLQNSYLLSMNCLQSEELLTQMLNGKMLDLTNLQEITRSMRLGTTPVIVETFEDLLYDMDGQVKVDSTQSSGVETEVKVVVNEVVEDSIKEEPGTDDNFEDENIDDEIPLSIVKHELVTPSVYVSEKLRPTEQGESPEDATAWRQAPAAVEDNLSTDSDNKTKKQKKNRPHICVHCLKSFNRKEHLKRHLRTHTGEEPFLCIMCDEKFYSQSTLNSHILHKHSSEEPYDCDKYDERFWDKRYLNRHLYSGGHIIKNDLL